MPAELKQVSAKLVSFPSGSPGSAAACAGVLVAWRKLSALEGVVYL